MKKEYVPCANRKCKNVIDKSSLESDDYPWTTNRGAFCSLNCFKLVDKTTYKKKMDELEHRIFGIDVDDRKRDWYEDV